MSRAAARLKVTSSPPSRILPDVGSSSPAIMRSVVVLPQPDGPSMTKNEPSATVKLDSLTAVKPPKALWSFSTRISAIALVPEVADDDKHHRAGEHGDERIRVETERQRLHQHN